MRSLMMAKQLRLIAGPQMGQRLVPIHQTSSRTPAQPAPRTSPGRVRVTRVLVATSSAWLLCYRMISAAMFWRFKYRLPRSGTKTLKATTVRCRHTRASWALRRSSQVMWSRASSSIPRASRPRCSSRQWRGWTATIWQLLRCRASPMMRSRRSRCRSPRTKLLLQRHWHSARVLTAR